MLDAIERIILAWDTNALDLHYATTKEQSDEIAEAIETFRAFVKEVVAGNVRLS